MSYRHGRNIILRVVFALGLVVSGNTTLALKIGVRPSEAVTALATYKSRPVEGRLSGGFPHFPFVPLEPANRTRGNNPFQDYHVTPDFLAWMRSTSELFAADAERPTARTRGNLGIAYLYGGYTAAATQELERAVTAAPNDAPLLSDLSAAQLALATESGSYEHFLSAVESAGRALRAGPMTPEAAFNRALALEALHMTSQARHAWDLYLRLDHDPAWRAEALARRATLSAPGEAAQWEGAKREILRLTQAGDGDGVKAIVERFPGLARTYARDELFPEWAEAVIRRDAETANRARTACQIIGSTLKRLHDDHFLSDAIRAIENAGKAAATLAKAHLALRRGQSLYDGYDIPSARTKFEQARAGFARAGDVAFETYATIGTASCDYHHYRYGETMRAVREVREIARSRGYKNLLARTWWIEGSTLAKSRNFRAAAAAYQTAVPIYTESEDWESHSQVSISLASALDILGEPRSARPYWLNGLKSRSRVKSPYRQVWPLINIGISLARNRRIWLAFDFIQEAVETALTAQDERVIPFALIVRGSIYREVRETEKARADLTRARGYAERCPDEILRGEMYANTLLCQGALDLEEDPERALVSLDQACDFIAASSYRYLLEEAHLLRARARRKLRDIDGAEQDLYTAISEIERDRQSFGYSHSLVSFSDPESVYNEMVSLQLDDRRRPDLAFHFADASRSPKLNHEVIRRGQTAPVATLEETKKNTPGGVTIVEYVPLADRLLIWVIQSDNSIVIKRPLAVSELEAAVKSLRSEIEKASSIPDTLAEAARLAEVTLSGIELASKIKKGQFGTSEITSPRSMILQVWEAVLAA